MANTVFFHKVGNRYTDITWKDIFSDYKEKHSKRDLEYALLAGTSLDSASEKTMLKKWRKPWIFFSLSKIGIAIVGIIYAVFAMSKISAVGTTGLINMTMIIPPLIPPFVLMIFFWELNIPRNISLYELIGMFVIGGSFTFLVTGWMFAVFPPSMGAASAPLREEPAKLVAASIFLYIYQKKRRIYGLSGLVIGAAVGAGFGAFESMDYAINIGSAGSEVDFIVNQVMRGVFSIGGHTLFCAPYVANLAYAMDGRWNWKAYQNRVFIKSFLYSSFLHSLWNGALSPILELLFRAQFNLLDWMIKIAVIILLWVQALYTVQLCMNQAVVIGSVAQLGQIHKNGVAHAADRLNRIDKADHNVPCVTLVGVKGSMRGKVWKFDRMELTVGRAPDCDIVFPPNAKGVSKRHLQIRFNGNGWVVRDLGSRYGTYVSEGGRLVPYTDRRLWAGNHIYLGGQGNDLLIHHL